jgi:hypothetical protein
MGKPKQRGLPPSRRPGNPGSAKSARHSRQDAETTPAAASEIGSKMHQIALQIDQIPTELARAVSEEDASHRPRSRATGAEVVDAGLLYRGSKAASEHVVTIDAYPNPEKPEGIVVRLDGWDGFLLVNLTRDRAQLLAEKLSAAVEKSTAWYGPAG